MLILLSVVRYRKKQCKMIILLSVVSYRGAKQNVYTLEGGYEKQCKIIIVRSLVSLKEASVLRLDH